MVTFILFVDIISTCKFFLILQQTYIEYMMIRIKLDRINFDILVIIFLIRHVNDHSSDIFVILPVSLFVMFVNALLWLL